MMKQRKADKRKTQKRSREYDYLSESETCEKSGEQEEWAVKGLELHTDEPDHLMLTIKLARTVPIDTHTDSRIQKECSSAPVCLCNTCI